MAARSVPLQRVSITRDGKAVSVAYRRYGAAASGTPLLMLIHYRANHHFWDPLLLASLAASRPVVVFDLPGTGGSGGTVPPNYQGWGDAALQLATALEMDRFDLAGFSMGGRAAQMAALTAPQRVRKLVLLGTDASTPLDADTQRQRVLGANVSREPFLRLTAARTLDEVRDAIAYSFFYHDDAGRAAAAAYWERVVEAAGDEAGEVLLPLDEQATQTQIAAAQAWASPGGAGCGSVERLAELRMPVLVCNGDDDRLIASVRSWLLLEGVNATGEASASGRAGAKLIIWPRSGHGFLWQYAEDVGRAINEFLDGDDGWGASARL